jgi:hypothetical protein
MCHILTLIRSRLLRLTDYLEAPLLASWLDGFWSAAARPGAHLPDIEAVCHDHAACLILCIVPGGCVRRRCALSEPQLTWLLGSGLQLVIQHAALRCWAGSRT